MPRAWIVRLIDLLIYAMWQAVEEGEVARNDAAALAYRSLVEGLGNLTPGVETR